MEWVAALRRTDGRTKLGAGDWATQAIQYSAPWAFAFARRGLPLALVGEAVLTSVVRRLNF
jgi:hypothetical protein